MKQISVDQIQEGDILGVEVRDDRGNVLLPAGSKLSTKHIRLLSRRQIVSVYILSPEEIASEGASSEGSSSSPAEVTKAARCARIERIFSRVQDHSLMNELRRLALERAERGALDD